MMQLLAFRAAVEEELLHQYCYQAFLCHIAKMSSGKSLVNRPAIKRVARYFVCRGEERIS
jgi:hypothetical protein